ncbi:hypothetical protein NHX12_004712 [Muraenolepis orangiensis]|uniref:Uncharacterized protein n=1 Tax=Muraenolepis orangiensis TaxID=630683 RepID=A0A9Q0IEV2_9TELE|nr:hypothetical protein NHX12_004712 [Muraenolepis orangiensis]
MITRNLILLVLLCLMEGLSSGALANRILWRRGAKLGQSRAADQWDQTLGGGDLVVTLRNLIGRDQEAEGSSNSYTKMLQSHAAASSGNKERPGLKPEREVGFVDNKQEVSRVSPGDNRESTQDAKRVRNDTKSEATAPAKAGKVEKAFMIHYRNDPHSDNNNKTSLHRRLDPRSRTKPVEFGGGEHTVVGGVPATDFGGETGLRLNLTGSYGVLKLLSKENLVRIVNSQLQSFQSSKGGGSRGRKRDLIDVNSGRSEAGRRDLTFTQSHSGPDNQTALPRVTPVTNLDPGTNHSVYARPDIFYQTILALATAKDKQEMRLAESSISSSGGGGGDGGGGGSKSKDFPPPVLSTPQNELGGTGKEKQKAASQTDMPPSTRPPPPRSNKHAPPRSPPQAVVFFPSSPAPPDKGRPGATGRPRNLSSGSRDPAKHVLKLRPDPGTAQEAKGGLVFEEAPSDEGEEEEEEAWGDEEEEEEEEEEERRRTWCGGAPGLGAGGAGSGTSSS